MFSHNIGGRVARSRVLASSGCGGEFKQPLPPIVLGKRYILFSPLDEDIDICSSCPISVGETLQLKRTLESTIEYKKESSSLAAFPCTHKVTGRPICAVPCDGLLEMCKDDADEQCEGPGLMMVLTYTFVAALVFLLSALTFDKIKKNEEPLTDILELNRINHENEIDVPYIYATMSLYKSNLEIEKSSLFARKVYEDASIPNGYWSKDHWFMDTLGTNKLTAFFYDCIDKSISIRILMFFQRYESLVTFIKALERLHVDILSHCLQCLGSLTVRYSDLPKDILLLQIIWIQLLSTDTGLFSISIFWSLASAIIATEIINIFHIMFNQISKKESYIKRTLVVISCPIMPAVYMFKQLKLKLLMRSLLTKFASNKDNVIEQEQIYKKLKCLEEEMCHLEVMSAKLHCNENVIENLTQLTISSIIILLSYTNTSIVETVEAIFLEKNNALTYIFAAMSFISIIRGQLNFLQANKNGCLGIKGKLIVLPYLLIGTSSR